MFSPRIALAALEGRVHPERAGGGARVELRLRAHLGFAHVGFVEGIERQRGACHSRREFPPQELAAQLSRDRRDAEDRMPGLFQLARERVDRARRVGRHDHKRAIRSVLGRAPERFADHGQNAAALLARAFRDELFDPGAERRQFVRQQNRELVAPRAGVLRHERAKCEAGILRRIAVARHGHAFRAAAEGS